MVKDGVYGLFEIVFGGVGTFAADVDVTVVDAADVNGARLIS